MTTACVLDWPRPRRPGVDAHLEHSGFRRNWNTTAVNRLSNLRLISLHAESSCCCCSIVGLNQALSCRVIRVDPERSTFRLQHSSWLQPQSGRQLPLQPRVSQWRRHTRSIWLVIICHNRLRWTAARYHETITCALAGRRVQLFSVDGLPFSVHRLLVIESHRIISNWLFTRLTVALFEWHHQLQSLVPCVP